MKDILLLLMGFFLGLWGNALSNNAAGSFRATWLKKFFHFLANPIQYFFWVRHPASQVVMGLFRAWRSQDKSAYMEAWDLKGVQISGSDGKIEFEEIKNNFTKKIAKYSETRPRIVLIEGVEKESSESFLIFIFYQFFFN